MTSTSSARAVSQYATTTDNLTARIALHAYGTNRLDWYSWLGERLPPDGEVLEVGAGTGALWKRVDHLVPGLNLTLTDFSSAMCAQLRAIPSAVVRMVITVNGMDHLAELDALGPLIGRPDLVLASGQNDFTAETAPARVARHFTGVTVERYPCDLDIPGADPVLAYLDSMSNRPLTPKQRSAARNLIQAKINAVGGYHVGKHSVLITASRSPDH